MKPLFFTPEREKMKTAILSRRAAEFWALRHLAKIFEKALEKAYSAVKK